MNTDGHQDITWSGRTVIQGGSVGANVTYGLASHLPGELTSDGVVAVSGWSGGIDLDYWHSQDPGSPYHGTLVCSTRAPHDGGDYFDRCEYGYVVKYDCGNPDDYQQLYGQQPCMGYVGDASSYNSYNTDYNPQITPPAEQPPVIPVFVANSQCEGTWNNEHGCPNVDPTIGVDDENRMDFVNNLATQAFGWQSGDQYGDQYYNCSVPGDEHATAYIRDTTKSCVGAPSGQDVLGSTLTFLNLYAYPSG